MSAPASPIIPLGPPDPASLYRSPNITNPSTSTASAAGSTPISNQPLDTQPPPYTSIISPAMVGQSAATSSSPSTRSPTPTPSTTMPQSTLRSPGPPLPHTPRDPSTSPSSSRRNWNPTPNVPVRLAARHGTNLLSSLAGEEDERHRWLSEDEGSGGVARSTGRRRRRGLRSGAHEHSSDRGGGGSGSPRPPPMTLPNNLGPFKPTAVAEGSSSRSSKQRSRPVVRRTHSFEPRVPSAGPSRSTGATDVTIGAYPPDIVDLVSNQSTPIRQHDIATRSGDAADAPEIARQTQARPVTVPDFALGRGGDGIGGIDRPSNRPSPSRDVMTKRLAQKDIIAQLRRLTAWCVRPSSPS